MLVSPGYDMEKSLRHMTPLADMVITLHAKSFFLTRNKDTLASSEHQDGAWPALVLTTFPPPSVQPILTCCLSTCPR